MVRAQDLTDVYVTNVDMVLLVILSEGDRDHSQGLGQEHVKKEVGVP